MDLELKLNSWTTCLSLHKIHREGQNWEPALPGPSRIAPEGWDPCAELSFSGASKSWDVTVSALGFVLQVSAFAVVLWFNLSKYPKGMWMEIYYHMQKLNSWATSPCSSGRQEAPDHAHVVKSRLSNLAQMLMQRQYIEKGQVLVRSSSAASPVP